jgi:predicted AAA+ superfamily ATPase
MKDIFKKIIVERQEWLKKIKLTQREIIIENNANYAFTGLRRAGKSYFLYQIIQEKLQLVNYDCLLLINFEDERLLEVSHQDLQLILDAYYELFELEPIIFLDEIQNVPHWQKFVRRLADDGRRVYVTGSNAEMLSHEIATTLGGRFINKEILPLSFQEYLSFKEVSVSSKSKYNSERYQIIKEYEEYLHFGGFPELIQMTDKREFLSSVYQKLFYGDLIARYKIASVVTLKLMVKKLAESVNNETSVNRIKNLIKSTGVSIGSNTLFDYLIYLESSYLIASISKVADNIPSFSQRSVWVAWEYAIPYHLGYYSQIQQRAIELIKAQYSSDLTLLQNLIQTHGFNFILLDQTAFTPEYLLKNHWLRQWYHSLGQEILADFEQGKTPALSQTLQQCSVLETEKVMVLEADCLMEL